jgi:hypothetical protein
MTAVTDRTIQEEIGSLADLDLVSLRRRWLGLYRSAVPTRMSRELLVQVIAYRLQENAFGGLPSVTPARIMEGSQVRAHPHRSQCEGGHALIREWQRRNGRGRCRRRRRLSASTSLITSSRSMLS